ncbi:MAG: hypothetical protein J6B99_06190 [Oscillospiraceae bacterium]|nr:hypothetical protein [Oscillospiraceae bacterium]
MTVLWCILGALALLIILVLLLRVGVLVSLTDTLTVLLRIGPAAIPLYPAAEKKEKPAKKAKPTTETTPKAKKKLSLDITRQDVQAALKAVWQALDGVFRRIGRRVRVTPCEVSVVVGGPWPDKVAEQYGLISAAVWTVMPRLEQLIHIRDPYIHLDVDFNAPATNVEGKLGLYLRVGDLLAIAFAAAKPLLKFYFPFRRRQKARQAAAAAQAGKTMTNNT